MKNIKAYILMFSLVSFVGCVNTRMNEETLKYPKLNDSSSVSDVGIISDESKKAKIINQIAKGSLDVEDDTFAFENLTLSSKLIQASI